METLVDALTGAIEGPYVGRQHGQVTLVGLVCHFRSDGTQVLPTLVDGESQLPRLFSDLLIEVRRNEVDAAVLIFEHDEFFRWVAALDYQL
ncbi:hypothetical protein A4G28_12325 [Mycobacterium ostraviense]|uniref:Uncharacterized protein n=1 Tax=Mycobacterium ostraviense TaxID=2738409 RepID=A0A164CH82_9MYCO|nr:hypothetical protein A4G28_12325 [Mycobacterium ostraviense]